MSSKPGAGINHKVYGVTSEGVNVFLACSLRARGIEPTKQPFTVKITGGPDGDVAGNMMRILDRDYGANARIVGVADGSGCGEDPDGLDHAELLRLFHDGLPIARFNPARLGPKGRITPVEAPEGAQLRNTMHNRVVADAFVPGGGRPATINERNWQDYLLPDGRPSSPIIVEGANLFLTPEARVRLSEKGCLIMKDSSANKCGVITSSYEIQASMLLDEPAFMKLKDAFVDQVLVKLREFARREAELLLAEGRRHPSVPLPELSTRLSKAMNAAADAVYASMGSWTDADKAAMREVILEHVPEVLAKAVGDRLFTVLPAPYQAWMVAKSLSSRIVYREGIDFFASIDANAVGTVVLGYLRKEKQIEQLIAAVRASGQPFAEQAAGLLAKAGTRAALMDL
jgi:glutamate dehydrogenase